MKEKISPLTPYQTVGPFFDFALTVPGAERMAGDDTAGRRITIEGIVLDGRHQPCGDALIELWQADASGHYRHPRDANRDTSPDAFCGFGRCGTDEAGRFSFSTIMPGPVPGPSGSQAPHALVGILARGLLTRLVTRMYFEESSSNAADPILQRVPASRRHTLIARRLGPNRYHFPIVLQGEGETVFFDV